MPLTDLPLSAYPSFRAKTVDSLSELAHAKLSAAITRIEPSRRVIDARGNRLALSSTELWSCSYGLPLCLKFPEGQYLRVQFHRKGQGATWTGREVIPINEKQSCIYAGPSETEFGEDYAQIVWRIPFDVLERKLAALIGHPVGGRLAFDPVLDLARPQSRTTLRILESLLGVSDAGPVAATALIRTELEGALLVSLLCAARHSHRDLLVRGNLAAAPWQVRRVESFIEANWNRPITLEDITRASGVSARSVFRTFRQSRGYTPLQFAKHVRLRQARRLLQDENSTLSVTEIALNCGFSDLSRFSKDFSRTFGEPPSALRRRAPPSQEAGTERR